MNKFIGIPYVLLKIDYIHMKRRFTILFGLLLIMINVQAKEFRTEYVAVITQDAINNFLYEQSSTSRTFTGTHSGITYDAAANVQIKRNQNVIEARLVVSGKLDYGNNEIEDFVWIVSTSVDIPSVSMIMVTRI